MTVARRPRSPRRPRRAGRRVARRPAVIGVDLADRLSDPWRRRRSGRPPFVSVEAAGGRRPTARRAHRPSVVGDRRPAATRAHHVPGRSAHHGRRRRATSSHAAWRSPSRWCRARRTRSSPRRAHVLAPIALGRPSTCASSMLEEAVDDRRTLRAGERGHSPRPTTHGGERPRSTTRRPTAPPIVGRRFVPDGGDARAHASATGSWPRRGRSTWSPTGRRSGRARSRSTRQLDAVLSVPSPRRARSPSVPRSRGADRRRFPSCSARGSRRRAAGAQLSSGSSSNGPEPGLTPGAPRRRRCARAGSSSGRAMPARASSDDDLALPGPARGPGGAPAVRRRSVRLASRLSPAADAPGQESMA